VSQAVPYWVDDPSLSLSIAAAKGDALLEPSKERIDANTLYNQLLPTSQAATERRIRAVPPPAAVGACVCVCVFFFFFFFILIFLHLANSRTLTMNVSCSFEDAHESSFQHAQSDSVSVLSFHFEIYSVSPSMIFFCLEMSCTPNIGAVCL
jgi:hypothetical protein